MTKNNGLKWKGGAARYEYEYGMVYVCCVTAMKTGSKRCTKKKKIVWNKLQIKRGGQGMFAVRISYFGSVVEYL